ncbi:MAG: SRPBCC domain-containing protein [Flavobacteriales bacterium]|nr:SRPBCC domain-containing protein [Flavobacteriales bacterium]
MKELETTITINASADRVWSVLMNFDDYPNWNPFIQQIKGDPQVGNTIEGTLKIEGKSPMVFKPEVLINDTEQEFRWLGHLFVKGLFDGEHYFKIRKTGPNETEFIQGEKFSGLLSGTLIKMIGEQTKQGFEQMNEALKQQTEKLTS